MLNVRIDIEYDGTNFCGWQHQPGLRSIERCLQVALETVLHQKVFKLKASGRTDAGVHAVQQTCNFFIDEKTELKKLIVGVSHLLRGEVSVLRAEYVPDDFSSRKSLIRKQYRYEILNRKAFPTISNGYVWHMPAAINLEIMRAQAKQFLGEHDFKSFQAVGCQSLSPVKVIEQIEIIAAEDNISFRVVGKSFLKQMVRIMVGTLVDLSIGKKMSCQSVAEILAKKDRQFAGRTAPACGLYLDWVEY